MGGGNRSSEEEAISLKIVIDRVTGESAVLVSVASETENKAKKTCMIIADEENRVSCGAHILRLSVCNFLSAYTNSPAVLLASTIVHEFSRIFRAFRSSLTCSDSFLQFQRDSNARRPLKIHY